MNKAALKRMTRRTEFYIFLVLVIMCILIQIISGGQLFEGTKIVDILRAMVVDGMFRRVRPVVPGGLGPGVFAVHHHLP